MQNLTINDAPPGDVDPPNPDNLEVTPGAGEDTGADLEAEPQATPTAISEEEFRHLQEQFGQTQQELKETKGYLDEQRAREREAQSQALQQEQMQYQNRLTEIARQAVVGLEPDEANVIAEAVKFAGLGKYVSTQQFKDQMSTWVEQANQHYIEKLAWDLAQQHLGPQTTLAAAIEFRNTLFRSMGTVRSKEAMETLAGSLATLRKEQNRRQRVQSGQERIEGGGTRTTTARSDTELAKLAGEGAPLTRAEIARVNAYFKREFGI